MSRSFGGTSFTIVPPMEIVPLVISSRPAIIRSVVDFPHPEGPTSTTNSLSAMSMFTSFTATTPPSYSFRMFSSLTLATVTSTNLPTCEAYPRMPGMKYQRSQSPLLSTHPEDWLQPHRMPWRCGDLQNCQKLQELRYFLS